MRSRARRWKLGAVAAALVSGAIGVAGAATPTGAQEADPPSSTTTSTTATTTAPPATPPTTGTTPTTVVVPPGSGPTTPTSPTPTTPPSTTILAPPTTATSTTTVPSPPAVAAPAAPLAAGAIRVEPATGLTDGTPVTVTATGLTPGVFVSARQCVTAAQDVPAVDVDLHCDLRESAFGTSGSDGTARLDLRVDALLATPGERLPDGSFGESLVTDCRRVGACVMAVAVESDVGGIEQALFASLDFTADAPLAPPPVATVAPATGLDDRQSVAVTASGLVWSFQAYVLQCRVDPDDFADCDSGSFASVETLDGTLTVQHEALAVMDTDSGPVDCRTETCEVVVTQDFFTSPGGTATAPLAFDPTAEVVPPTLTVSPTSGLVDGQRVTATGSGFLDQFVSLHVCAPNPADGCHMVVDGFAFVENGGFTIQVPVDALVSTPAGDLDCRTSPEPCLLVATASSPTSIRAGRAELHFAPGGPLRPAPAIMLDPASDLPEQGLVEVRGRNFAPSFGPEVLVEVCEVAAPRRCDPQAEAVVEPAANGRFTVEIDVAASFAAGSATVDCRAEAGCHVVATAGFNGRRATAPLDFAPFVPPDERYLEPVFADVEVTRGVVYRHTTGSTGAPVDLTLDIYQPAGDTEEHRPAVVWLPGAWFSGGDTAGMAAYAEAFARRGYVAVTMSYRQRPGLRCCPTNDVEGVTDALLDAYDDARAGVRWLRDHAEDYRIDPDAIAAGGASAGAATAVSLAHLPGQMGRGGAPSVAAAMPIAGVDLGRPDAGEPPVLAFHGREDDIAPLHLSQSSCARARRVGAVCGAIGYDGVWNPASQRQRDIIRRSGNFLAEMVLDPLGYLDWTGPPTVPDLPPQAPPSSPPGEPAGGPPPAAPLPGALTGTPGTAAGGMATLATASGALPRTGAEAIRLVAMALGLLAVGAALVAARRRRRVVGDRGSAAAGVAVAIALVALLGGAVVVTGGLLATTSDDGGDEAAGDHSDRGDHSDHGGDGDDHAASGHDGEDDDHAGHDQATGIHPADHATGGHDADHDDADHDQGDHLHNAGGPVGSTHPHEPGDPTHPHDPGPPGGSPHPHDPAPPGRPQHPHPDPPVPPGDGIDPDWTAAQKAFARALIADTEASLTRYANPAILPLVGYQWIGDGARPGEYQHWIHLSRISDPRRLDADAPESLVLRTTADGAVLEAAMYMLPPGYHLGNIPADIAWLPGWHVHDNLCFENGFDLVGVAVDGRCERGTVIVTPPMVHVWIVDTRCGRFAGVDENGLQCDHDH